MKPSELLDTSRIVLGISPGTPKEEIIRTLVSAAMADLPDGADKVAADLVKREGLMTTGIGQGVAIPHCRTSLVDAPVAALGISRRGVDWEAVDGEDVHIIFAFVTPESNPAVHVQMLGATAEAFADERTRDAVAAASSADEILSILKNGGA